MRQGVVMSDREKLPGQVVRRDIFAGKETLGETSTFFDNSSNAYPTLFLK